MGSGLLSSSPLPRIAAAGLLVIIRRILPALRYVRSAKSEDGEAGDDRRPFLLVAPRHSVDLQVVDQHAWRRLLDRLQQPHYDRPVRRMNLDPQADPPVD